MIAALVLAAVVAGDMPPPDSQPPKTEPETEIQVRCNGVICVMPQELVREIVEAHNAQVAEIRALQKRLESTSCKPLPPLKPERRS